MKPQNKENRIGNRLRMERGRLDLTQAEFGALGGVTVKSQGSYEKGERKPDTDYLVSLSGHGVDVSFVITGRHAQELLTPEEARLLSIYRHSTEKGKTAIDVVLNLAVSEKNATETEGLSAGRVG